MQTDTGETVISGEQLGRVLDNVPEMVYSATVDEPVMLSYVNSTVHELTGYSAEEFISGRMSWMDIVHKEDAETVMECYRQSSASGGEFSQEYRIVRSDGSLVSVLDRGRGSGQQDGVSGSIDGMLTDITLRKKGELQLERTQLLQSIGRLAAGIVHEINTPVQFIGDNMHFLSDSFRQLLGVLSAYRSAAESAGVSSSQLDAAREAAEKADIEFLEDEIPNAIDQTVEGVKRVSTIVAAMRDFSHFDERRFALGDLNKALRSTLTVVHNELKYVANVETDFDRNLPQVLCCVDDMNQVFVNLLVNAAHSIGDVIDKDSGEKGTIRVTTRREGDEVVITISDTGTGISEEVQEKMFEPFFTTKGGDKGTGQGLLFVKTIVVDKHKGRLDWETELGRGTKFIITLGIETQQGARE